MVPAATNRGAVDEVDGGEDDGGDDDVGDCGEADVAVGGLWGQAEVEDEHGELGEGVAGAAKGGGGIAELVVG